MTGARRRLVVFTMLVGMGAAAFYSLRFIPFFTIRQVEIVGLRYLHPDTVLDGLALDQDRNLFEDLGALKARALTIPGIERVETERRLPGTLRLTVDERVPVALLARPDGLQALDGAGEALPYDPTVSGMSLPIVLEPDTSVLRVLSLIRVMDASLYEIVDAAGAYGEAIALRSGTRTVAVQSSLLADDLMALQAVRRDLAQRAESFRAIDTRYDGWIVVRREGV